MNVRSIQIYVLKFLGLEDEFRNSRYGSYGWFLRSKGIYVKSDGVVCDCNSVYKSSEDILNGNLSSSLFV